MKNQSTTNERTTKKPSQKKKVAKAGHKHAHRIPVLGIVDNPDGTKSVERID